MAQIRYAIRRISVSAMLSHAKPEGDSYTCNLTVPQTKSVIMETGNMAYYEPPGIADYEHGDYRISEDSQIYRDIVGFEPIPVEKIGRE